MHPCRILRLLGGAGQKCSTRLGGRDSNPKWPFRCCADPPPGQLWIVRLAKKANRMHPYRKKLTWTFLGFWSAYIGFVRLRFRMRQIANRMKNGQTALPRLHRVCISRLHRVCTPPLQNATNSEQNEEWFAQGMSGFGNDVRGVCQRRQIGCTPVVF